MQSIQFTGENTVEETTVFTKSDSLNVLAQFLKKIKTNFFRSSVGSKPLTRKRKIVSSMTISGTDSIANDYDKIAQNQLEYTRIFEEKIQKLQYDKKKFKVVA
jgi:hypothetical protein